VLTILDDSYAGQDDCGMDGDQRVGDADRERVVDRLQDHLAAGRLSMEEFLQRSEAAATARTAAELTEPLRDLPDDADLRPRGRRDPAWRAHALVAAAVSGGMIGLWQLTRDPTPAPRDYGADYWWPLWFGFFWSLAVLLHYLYAAGRLSLPVRRHPAVEPPPPSPPTAVLDVLTKREREILALVAEGCANKEIARRLVISERTARTHVSSILRKLDLPSRTQAALFAVRAGLADSPGSDEASPGHPPS
jgi:DNA-binding CsgD family transcriptional regulator